MKTRLAILTTLAALLAALPATALADSARGAGNTQTYTDSVGEDPSAPDITSITVSNDDAGLITFQINISNRPALTPDMFVLVFLDTDRNQATGDPNSLGADYAIELDPGAVNLFRWNGSGYVPAGSQTSLTYAYASTGPTIEISAADLGNTKAFDFGVTAASGATTDANGQPDYSNIHTDFAPDPGHGFYSYQVLTRLVLTVTAFTTAPKPPKAGRPFAASLAANENDLAGPVRKGTVSCAATIAGKRVVARSHVLANGVASCVWRLPAAARGKTIRGTITLAVRDASVSRRFSTRIT